MSNSIPTLDEIRTAAQHLGEAHRQTVARAKLLEDEVRQAIQPIYDAHRAGIDAAAEEEAAAYSTLRDLLGNAASLFVKPRSLNVDGVRAGYRKEEDGLDWDNDADVIARISTLPELEDLEPVLVRTTRALNLSAIEQLEPKLQRRIGVRRVEGADRPFITIGDSGVEKMVKAIITDAKRSEDEPAPKKPKSSKKAKEVA